MVFPLAYLQVAVIQTHLPGATWVDATVVVDVPSRVAPVVCSGLTVRYALSELTHLHVLLLAVIVSVLHVCWALGVNTRVSAKSHPVCMSMRENATIQVIANRFIDTSLGFGPANSASIEDQEPACQKEIKATSLQFHSTTMSAARRSIFLCLWENFMEPTFRCQGQKRKCCRCCDNGVNPGDWTWFLDGIRINQSGHGKLMPCKDSSSVCPLIRKLLSGRIEETTDAVFTYKSLVADIHQK